MSTQPQVLHGIDEMKAFEKKMPLGFVPTMGYLHEGHLSLLRRAREECSSVVLSIFINPLQFGPDDDLDRYPRDEDQDLLLAREVGADAVFIPRAEEMYPEAFTTEVRVLGLEDVLEGAARPDHFAGVATVLAKLLNVVRPDRMYMGQKDAQQAVLVRRMIEDLHFPTRLVTCPTVREPDGLAMSSRNVYLSSEERSAATVLQKALFEARDSGERAPKILEERVRKTVSTEPLVDLEYISASDSRTLGPVEPDTSEILLSLAARLGKTRLIDNVIID
ncbi:MAG: pantoate--beta-alanine ligase [Rubrobacteraceae bacterium]